MINTILGSKKAMSHTYVEGVRTPVTKVMAGPCVVTQIRQKSGRWTIQFGFGLKRIKNLSKPLQGHLKAVTKEDLAPKYLKEIQVSGEPQYKVGDVVSLSDVLEIGDTVTVSGTSKGKGFAGAVKRWHFSGGPRTHGQSDRERAPGSIGQGTTPGRVYKGKHMAGRMGSDSKTIKNLKVVDLNPETNEVSVSGPIPGTVGSLVIIKRTSERQQKEPQVGETNES